MLKKLRWKFILVITALLGGMLAAALAVQTISAARQYQEETERVLRAVPFPCNPPYLLKCLHSIFITGIEIGRAHV